MVANYDVSADGQRFLMVKDESSSGRINVVLNLVRGIEPPGAGSLDVNEQWLARRCVTERLRLPDW